MAETITVPAAVEPAPEDFETKAKGWLKDKYGIEDDPDTFKTKHSALRKAAEEDLPQYQSTLAALIEAARADAASQPQRQAPVRQAADDDEERLRTVSRLDPYEGMKAFYAKQQATSDERYAALAAQSDKNTRDLLARERIAAESMAVAHAQWPEAWDASSELHKLGKQIYRTEMSQFERDHPRSMLIATERAAGRLGLAPQGKRVSAGASRDEVEHQNVSGQGKRARTASNDNENLTEKQKKIAETIGLTPETYKQTIKARKEGKDLRVA